MSKTDPRAVAMIRFEMPKRECCTTTLQPDPQGQWVLYTDAVNALADAERQVCEAVEEYASEQADIHFTNGNTQGRLAMEAMELWVLTRQAQADKEG